MEYRDTCVCVCVFIHVHVHFARACISPYLCTFLGVLMCVRACVRVHMCVRLCPRVVGKDGESPFERECVGFSADLCERPRIWRGCLCN